MEQEQIRQKNAEDNFTDNEDIKLSLSKSECNKLELDSCPVRGFNKNQNESDKLESDSCPVEGVGVEQNNDKNDYNRLESDSCPVNQSDGVTKKNIQNESDYNEVSCLINEGANKVCEDMLKIEESATSNVDIETIKKENLKNNLADKTEAYRRSVKNDDFDPLSEGCIVVKRDNTSLCNLLLYSSAESSASSSSTDSESNSEDAINKNDAICIESKKPVAAKPKKHVTLQHTLKRLGELSIDDLPPVPDLSKVAVNVGPHDCEQMGTVSSIIDKLVMVESIPNHPAYDIDTMLFINDGKEVLGLVHDVIGPVSCPIYVIRFNSAEQIKKQNICKGLPVFSAPKSEHTQYVFLPQLLAAKGSDASWQNDKEVPAEFVDFSDDEAERLFRNNLSANNRKRRSHERHRNFEKNMNIKNLIDSKIHNLKDKSSSSIPKPSVSTTYKPSQLTPNFRPVFASQPGVLNVPLVQMWPRVGVTPPRITRPPFSNIPPFNQGPIPFFCPTVPPPPIRIQPRSDIMVPNLPNLPPPPPPGVDMPANDTTAVVYPPNLGLPGPRNFPVPQPPTVPNMSVYPMPNPQMFYYNYSVPVTNPSGNNRPSRPVRPSYFPRK